VATISPRVIFKKEFLVEDLCLPHAAISHELVDNTRWALVYDIIFQHDGKFYKTSYSKGATEQQDQQPWDNEDEVECIEVEKKIIEVEAWVPVIKTK
jgi:hypothetical protein